MSEDGTAARARVAHLADLFDRAVALPASDRAAFVDHECGGDAGLREELSALLDAHASSTGFFENLAGGVLSPGYAAVLGNDARDETAPLAAELETALRGSYRIERELGGGGMSRVFLAEEIKLGRKVVIKVLPGRMAATVSGERFRREIQLAAQLQHPHIVPLLASDSTDRLLYYTMPFVAGESLRARIAQSGALPLGDAMKIWRDVLDALAYAHARGVVHRDIKPANILLSGRNALVADFGIARAIEAAATDADMTSPGVAIGTPAYMAPEQVTGDPNMDHRVDVYAAGLVMYEMVEGRPPFSGRSPHDLLTARLATEPASIRRAECPHELAGLVLRCLHRDPAARPATADELLAALDALPGESRARKRRTPLAYALLPLVLAAAVFAAARLRNGAVPIADADHTPAIAVLPLTAPGEDASDVALANGMTEELIAVLGRERRLRVMASTSVYALRDRQLTVQQIAESLQATHLLEGSLQKFGARMRMQLRLVSAGDGSTRWSETYDRELHDIFAVQDDIARSVAAELNVRVGGANHHRARQRLTPSVAAYEWYLRGRDLTLLRSHEGRRRGIEYFSRAIEADSNFAAAYAGLAEMYGSYAGSAPADYRNWDQRAERSALKAVELDDSLAEAHAALGWARLIKRDWTGAEAELKRAIALDPAVHRGYEGLARLYMFTRRPGEQLDAARRGVAASPYSASALREMALALNMNGRCDETLELLRPLKSLSPPAGVAGVIMGQCYLRKQMWPEAIAEFHWVTDSASGRSALAFLGYALARSGQRREAERILADFLSGRQRSHDAFGVAVVYTGLRDYDRAFTWLDRAIDESSIRVYIMDPIFDDLHRDRRWRRFMTRFNSPVY